MAHDPADAPSTPLLETLKQAVCGTVRAQTADLTTRQLAVLLICTLDLERAHTVRGLAAQLKISGPGVGRSLDRLAAAHLVRRLPDPADRRSILVGRTPAGVAYVAMLRGLLVDSGRRS